MVISFIGMIVRWKTPKRRGHVIRLVVATVLIPCQIGLMFGFIHLIYVPEMSRHMMAEHNAARVKRFADTTFVHVGDRAPDFSLTTTTGENFSLAEAKGDVVVINFFATTCGPCHEELPHIEKIWAERKQHQNFHLLVIGREESDDTVTEYCEKRGFTFPTATDPDRAVYSLFAKEGIPRTIVVAPDGSIVVSQLGFYEENIAKLNTVLDEYLP